MKLKIKEFNIYIEETIFIVAILSIIFSKVREFFSNYFVCFLFIAFHEFSHMFVASICGIKTTRLSIRISGLCINLNNKSQRGLKWLAIFLAGPISNVVLALMFKNVPMVYTINLVLALVNLVPIYPLDGYNIFGILLDIFNVKNTQKIQHYAESFVIIFLGIIGGYQLVIFKNPSMVLMTIYIIIESSNGKKNQNSSLYQKYYKNVTNFNKNY